MGRHSRRSAASHSGADSEKRRFWRNEKNHGPPGWRPKHIGVFTHISAKDKNVHVWRSFRGNESRSHFCLIRIWGHNGGSNLSKLWSHICLLKGPKRGRALLFAIGARAPRSTETIGLNAHSREAGPNAQGIGNWTLPLPPAPTAYSHPRKPNPASAVRSPGFAGRRGARWLLAQTRRCGARSADRR